VSTVHPRVVAALRAQLGSRRAALDAGARHVGWKIGLGIPEVEALIGSYPVMGHVTTATRLRSGDAFRAPRPEMLRAETEIAIEVGRDRSIARFAVALELVDVGPPAGLQGIVADRILDGWLNHVPVGPGDHAVAEIDGLGRLEVAIVG
jgi:hypothetical protein